MIVFTDLEMYPYIKAKSNVFIGNLCCPAMIGARVDGLLPPPQVINVANWDDNAFEVNYVPWILMTQEPFEDFMKIMLGEYYLGHSFILCDFSSAIIESVVDCVLKLMRERYGKVGHIAFNVEDLMKIEDAPMTEKGAQLFIQDKEIITVRNIDPQMLKQLMEEGEEYAESIV